MSPRYAIVIGLLLITGASMVSATSSATALVALPDAPSAIGTMFTYQGRLTDGGAPANGFYDFEFRLYDALSGGAQVGNTLTPGDINVSNGLFTVSLDFGASAFTGNPRYLNIGVRPGASTGAYTNLTPRQPISPAPYALYTTHADQLDGVHASGFLSSAGGIATGHIEIRSANAELRLNDTTDATVEAALRVNGESLEIVEVEDTSSPPQSSLGGNVWMTFEDGGRVGIGTTNPTGKLHVAADSTQRAIYLSGGPAITSSLTSKWNLPPTSGNGTLSFITDNWDASGGVGFIHADNVSSPVVWMYNSSGRNAFTVARKAYAGTGENVATIDNYLTPLFQVRENGNVGIGTVTPQAKLDVNGTTRAKVVQITGGADLAEPFDVSGDRIEAGYVVAIDPDRPGELRVSDRAYDNTVAGCISGANGVKPGLIMQHEGTSAAGQHPVALSGRVYCYADAGFGAIAPGDLLTTSDTPGHLQVVTDHDRARGAIVGKAMSALQDGRGLILVLVALQ